MRAIFVLTFKETAEQRFYSSLVALAEENTREEIGVSLSTLQKYDFSFDFYENEKCTIKTSQLKSKSDVLREREQFV